MKHRFPAYELATKQLERSDIRFAAPDAVVLATGNPRVFDGGEAAFAEIISRVEQAERSIEVRAFLWRDDEVGNRLGAAILAAAERGVKVEILKDRIAAVYEYTGGNKQSFFHKRVSPSHAFQAWFLGRVYRSRGSFRQRPNQLADAVLGHRNITVAANRRRFDHSKIFIFDDRFITLGSMGIGDNHHSDWLDMVVELEGADHVTRLRERMAGGDEFNPSRGVDFLVHSHEAHRKKTCPMLGHRLALIDAAQTSITVEMAYLGDRRFTLALVAAIQRGVDVTLITAAHADVLGNLNLSTLDKLLRVTGAPENLTIVLLPRMVHSKMVVIDHRISDIGSANFTPLSHGVYEEINLYVDDARFAGALEAAAASHCEEGVVVERSRLGYRRIQSSVERAIVAYQSRKGGKIRLT